MKAATYKMQVVSGAALVSSVLVLTAGSAVLNDARAQDQQQTAERGVLEEIVVSARRREESLQDIPVSVTALTPEFLQEQNIVNTDELSEFVPNLRIGTGERQGSDQFSIRGITRQSPGGDPTTNAPVGLYLNGVYIPAGIANHLPLHDAQRVEILRGPQGTLFGRNTTAGAINIVTTRPHAETEGEIMLRTGSHNRQDAEVMLNAPLSDNLFGRVSVALDRRDGYYKNLLLGTTHNDRDIRTVDAAVRWQPTDRLTVDFNARHMDQKGNNRGADCIFLNSVGYHDIHEANGGGNFEDACRETEAAGRYNFYSQWPMYLDSEHETLTLEAEWLADGPVGFFETFGVTANVGYFELGYSFLIDSHYTRELLETRGTYGSGQTEIYKNAELIFEGTVGRSDILFGVNWYDEAGWQNRESFDRCYNMAESVIGTGQSVTCPAPGGFFFNNQPFNTSGSGPSPFFGNVEATSEIASAFTHAKFTITDWFRLDGGLRYTRETRTFRNFEASITPAAAGFLDWDLVLNDDTIDLFGQGKDTWTEVTPMLSANFLVGEVGPMDDGMFYALWSRGFTSGGFNTELDVRGTPQLAPLQSYDPEIIDNYEFGIKSTLLDRRLQVNLSVFRMEYSDKQESISVDNSDGTFGSNTSIEIISNAAEAKVEGFEFEYVALIGERFRIDGGWARQSPKFTDFMGFNPQTGEVEDLSNLRLNTEPEYTYTGNFQYTHPLESGADISSRIGVYYQSETDTAVAEFGVTERTVCYQPDFTTVNARVTYDSPDSVFSLSLFGRNLTNEDVLLRCGLSNPRGRWTPMYEDRATWGLEGRYRF